MVFEFVEDAAFGVIRQEGPDAALFAHFNEGGRVVLLVLPARQRQVLQQHGVFPALQEGFILADGAGKVARGVAELGQQHPGLAVVGEIIEEALVFLGREVIKAHRLVHCPEVIEGARVGQTQGAGLFQVGDGLHVARGPQLVLQAAGFRQGAHVVGIGGQQGLQLGEAALGLTGLHEIRGGPGEIGRRAVHAAHINVKRRQHEEQEHAQRRSVRMNQLPDRAP